MRAELRRADGLALAALGLAWLGIWGAWIPHKTAGLTQNADVLAYWSGVLPEVRSGPLALMPDLLRLGIALASVALSVSAGAIRSPWLRWAVRLVALLPGLILLPPYPFVLDLWNSPEYGRRFIIAMVLWLGVPASGLMDLLPGAVRRALVIVLAAGGAALGGWAFVALSAPFAARYAQAIPPGWGVVAFVAGLALASLVQAIATLRGRQAAPETR